MLWFSKGFERQARFLVSNRSIEKFVAQCISRDTILVQEVDLKVDDEGDDEVFTDLKSDLESSQCVCVGLISV